MLHPAWDRVSRGVARVAFSANEITGQTEDASASAPTIYVCITCRGPDGLLRDPLPGQLLAAATVQAAQGTGIQVRPIRCLANCSRGPSAAMRANGSWTYIFGGLDAACAPALVIGARMLAQALDGILPWRGRPDVLKRGLCARMPPLDFKEAIE
jgi:predicted metal-binding protein